MRFLTTRSVAAAVLATLLMAGCSNGAGVAEEGVQRAAAPPEVQALIDQAREEPVRVIVNGKAPSEDPAAVADVTARIVEAAKASGVESVEALEGQPLVMMEGVSAEALEALWATGAVQSIELDEPRGMH